MSNRAFAKQEDAAGPSQLSAFFRFSIPGFACLVELGIALAISDRSATADFLKSIGGDTSIGLVLGTLLASGGLGYILAQLYWALYWTWPFSRLVAVDHLSLLCSLVKSEHLEIITIREQGNKYVVTHTEQRWKLVNEGNRRIELTKRDAWRIVSQYWPSQQAKDEDEELHGVYPVNSRLLDVAHSLGATIIGTALSFLAWFSIHYWAIESNRHSFYQYVLKSDHCSNSYGLEVSIVMYMIVMCALCMCYWRTLKAVQSIANSTLAKKIMEESRRNGKRTRMYYVK